MNIFATSPCPFESAKNLDDSRVNKMILESAQMLAACDIGYPIEVKYPKYVKNHKVTKWVNFNISNYLWLYEHFNGLLFEYKRRSGKTHAYDKHYKTLKMFTMAHRYGSNTPDYPKSFLNYAKNQKKGIDYTHIKDVYLAYQLYLNDKWNTDKRQPTWYGEKR